MSIVSVVLAISPTRPYLISMCNLTALPPQRPAAKRHHGGTLAALRRCRTAKSAPPRRTKTSQIRYLCAPNCGIFLEAGTARPRMAAFFGLKSLQTWPTHLENSVICATWILDNFSRPKLYFGLPFSLPGPTWPPFLFPKVRPGNKGNQNPPCPPWPKGGLKVPL